MLIPVLGGPEEGLISWIDEREVAILAAAPNFNLPKPDNDSGLDGQDNNLDPIPEVAAH